MGRTPCGCERRRSRITALGKLAVVVLGLVILLLILGMDDAPPPGATVAQTAATTAAAQEYERVLSEGSTPGLAEAMARETYEEVLARWER